MLTGQQS